MCQNVKNDVCKNEYLHSLIFSCWTGRKVRHTPDNSVSVVSSAFVDFWLSPSLIETAEEGGFFPKQTDSMTCSCPFKTCNREYVYLYLYCSTWRSMLFALVDHKCGHDELPVIHCRATYRASRTPNTFQEVKSDCKLPATSAQWITATQRWIDHDYH